MIENKYKKVEDIIVKRARNAANTAKTTGYKGVNLRYSNKFHSKFTLTQNNKQIDIHLGSYDTAEEAYIARLKFIDSLK